jgi:5-methyltetrahydrofolate--homocysteine methyltransferase
VHTAVKIDPHYDKPVVHVLDASRSVPVVSDLLSDDKKVGFAANIREEYEKVRENFQNNRAQKEYLSIGEAKGKRLVIDFTSEPPVEPLHIGVNVFKDQDLAELVPFIDWSPFFRTWELHGKYPAILTDPVVGEAATELFEDAQKMLKRIIDEKWIKAHGVAGIWPANTVGDDIEVYSEAGDRVKARFHMMRQQSKKADSAMNQSLADFIAPKELGIRDHIGGFAVTTGDGIRPYVEQFEAVHDDHSSILLKALADRLAEAFAEMLHRKVRHDIWGYANGEQLSNDDLIKEKYQGIRPAPGYPACPDHTEKLQLFKLLSVEENTGITLTENLAMSPAASVCGWYFAHPQSKYFGIGKIGKDQVEDLAHRKSMGVEEMEDWLQSSLNYERERVG